MIKFESRKVKHRVWHINSNIMEYTDSPYIGDSGYWDGVHGTILEVATNYMHSKNKIFLEYTGLNDIEKNEIYEADLFEAPAGNIYLVAWNSQAAKFSVVTVRTNGKMIGIPKISMQDLTKMKKIGNVFQNPELLQDSKLK